MPAEWPGDMFHEASEGLDCTAVTAGAAGGADTPCDSTTDRTPGRDKVGVLDLTAAWAEVTAPPTVYNIRGGERHLADCSITPGTTAAALEDAVTGSSTAGAQGPRTDCMELENMSWDVDTGLGASLLRSCGEAGEAAGGGEGCTPPKAEAYARIAAMGVAAPEV